jgi:hypothetical protein
VHGKDVLNIERFQLGHNLYQIMVTHRLILRR